ncbi:MAG TPA: YqjK family protein [Burkholderiales bacterium]
MSARIRQILSRRRMLVALAAEQRGRLAADSAVLRQSLSVADSLRRAGHYIKSQPLLVGATAAGLMLIGPRRLLRLGYRSGLLLPVVLRIIRAVRRSG